jgi:hypothetical protein
MLHVRVSPYEGQLVLQKGQLVGQLVGGIIYENKYKKV